MSEEITTLKTCLLQMQNANIDLVKQLDDCRRECAKLKELPPKSESSLENPHHIQGVVLDQLFAENKKQGERIVELLKENASLKALLIERVKPQIPEGAEITRLTISDSNTGERIDVFGGNTALYAKIGKTEPGEER